MPVAGGDLAAQAGSPGPGNPCGPGYRRAPQTDRCDPIPGASGAKARAEGLAGRFPVAGQSLGGIVRSRPSQSAPKIASLAEGAPMTIVELVKEMKANSKGKAQEQILIRSLVDRARRQILKQEGHERNDGHGLDVQSHGD